LIADDEPHNLQVLSNILVTQGYRIRVADGGGMALAIALAEPPSLVLLDIMMPDLDGYEVCRQLKADPALAEVPVIFLSALTSLNDKVKAFQVGGADYITKPFQVEEVLLRVRTHLTLRDRQAQLHRQNLHLQQEIDKRRQAQQETQFLLEVIRGVSAAADFVMALQGFMQQVCQSMQWDLAEAWISEDQDTAIRLAFVCSATETWDRGVTVSCGPPELSGFYDNTQKITLTPGWGLVGRLWKTHQAEWLTDFDQVSDAVFVRREAALQASLRTAFGIPLLLDQQTVGVMVFLSHRSRSPEPAVMQLVKTAAIELQGVLRRIRTEAALQAANHKLQRLSEIDELTQLPNRRVFNDTLARAWRDCQRSHHCLALILADVDDFKAYNDWYGHPAGDDCLRQVAQALKTAIHNPEVVVARYGGEEFAIVAPWFNHQAAVALAETLAAAIRSLALPHERSRVGNGVTLSLGVTAGIPTTLPAHHWLKAADAALYQAKQSGRDRACWIPLETPDCPESHPMSSAKVPQR
jgi:diguanylate cyclase (GGDEF)-like protein